MTEFKAFEPVLRSELEDDTICYLQDVKGGIVNRAALFVSEKTSDKYFVKYHDGEQDLAETMFSTEKYSLDLLERTKIVHVPKSIKIFGLQNHRFRGGIHVLEYIEDLQPMTDYWPQLGEQVARLHSYNSNLRKKASQSEQSIHRSEHLLEPRDKFGSDVPHFIGTFHPRDGWRDTWEEYFLGDIVNPLFEGLEQKHGDRVVSEKWSAIKQHIHKVFQSADIQPEINHGDLCPANFGQTADGAVVFDPSVNYAHSEFDLIIAKTEGGFHDDFFTSYYNILPKAKGFEDRVLVYELFYNVVMWYHVPEGQAREATIKSLDQVKELIKNISSAN
ncbi:fructosamine-3-kinase-like [Haliotis rubra]|uniref:fructosamine-3-kinase-like n=1 Tax=Haliotis rubra TaxID=36100 RepID=UPI001EE5BF33|nr:fructosamine-3-kinase-like [Haliotis rubra]